MTHRPVSRGLLGVLAALTAVIAPCLVAGALGQQVSLTEDIISASALTQPQRDRLHAFVAETIPMLASDNPSEVKRGRSGLLAPLDNKRISVSFRLAYSEELTPILSGMARGRSELGAINALVVAGPLATVQATTMIEQFVKDNRAAVRYAAMSGLRRTFEALESTSPAIGAPDAASLVDRIAIRLLEEDNPQVFDACVRTLIQAGALRRQSFEGVSAKALSALATKGGERLRKLSTRPDGEELLAALVRAGGALRDAASNPQTPVSSDLARDMVAFGGDMWGWMYRGITGGDNAGVQPGDADAAAQAKRDRRLLASQAVSIGQAVMYFAADRLTAGEPFKPSDAPKWVAEATLSADAQFLRRAKELLGGAGPMTRPPLNFAVDRFVK
jgi:hypothetical protein